MNFSVSFLNISCNFLYIDVHWWTKKFFRITFILTKVISSLHCYVLIQKINFILQISIFLKRKSLIGELSLPTPGPPSKLTKITILNRFWMRLNKKYVQIPIESHDNLFGLIGIYHFFVSIGSMRTFSPFESDLHVKTQFFIGTNKLIVFQLVQ